MKRRKTLIIILAFAAAVTLALVLLPARHSSSRLQAVALGPVADSSLAKAVNEFRSTDTNYVYGVPAADYTLIRQKVKRNELMADLLLPHGVSMQQIMDISALPDSLIDARRIRQGNAYAIFLGADSTAKYFAYEKDPLHYVVVDLRSAEPKAWNAKKPLERRLKISTGQIKSSLWLSMREGGSNPLLANELSEIFAWSIDFFGVQPGDAFKVIYEESYIDSTSLGIDRVLGAWFLHNDTEFWGIPFVQDSVRSFFDEEGNSLRKAFLKAPLRYSRISSGFSHSRYHPVLKYYRPHHGVDYAAAAGTPVQSIGDGVITKVGYQRNGGGNYVKIKHNSVYSTTYMHLRGFATGVRAGVYVKQGEVIGYVGSTGLATGPHLDFRFYKNGSAVNPLKVEAPPVEPVAKENQLAFGLKRLVVMQAINMI